jgi:nitroreductase
MDFSSLNKSRRSIRDFKKDLVPESVLKQILDDALWSPSWSNTHPYYLAIAKGEELELIKKDYLKLFDQAWPLMNGNLFQKLTLLVTRRGWPDGDFRTIFKYPPLLQKRRIKTGKALYEFLGITRDDKEGKEKAWRQNFEFFGAPVVMFLFVHKDLKSYAALDAGIFLQTIMLSAHSKGLGTCAQGALATWASPVRNHLEIPKDYKLIVGLSLGYPSDNPVNTFNVGRDDLDLGF